MNIHRQIVVFDTPDLDGEAGFWARLLGGEVTDTEDADWRTVRVDGEPRLGFQLAPNHERPDWPDGAQQQLHLDLYVDDIREAHERPEAMEEAAVMMTGLSPARVLQGLAILETRPRGPERAIRLPSDYAVPDVADKIVRIILSYTDYVRRTVWREP